MKETIFCKRDLKNFKEPTKRSQPTDTYIHTKTDKRGEAEKEKEHIHRVRQTHIHTQTHGQTETKPHRHTDTYTD